MADSKDTGYIKRLFERAGQAGREYVYTLLRVTGPELDRSDSLIKLRSRLSKQTATESHDDLAAEYQTLAGNEDVIELIANLLNCVQGKPYSSVPFHHLDQGSFPQEIIRGTLPQKIGDLRRVASQCQIEELSSALENAYSIYVSNSDFKVDHDELINALHACTELLTALLETYFSERLRFRQWNRFHKVSAFEVMELLTNDEYGLYGFRMHFPTGSHALFERHPDTHEGRNFFVPEISFFVGLINEMQSAWSIEGKRLHELNLPGRYNRLGEWKPIAGPMAIELLSTEARSSSDDPDIQGSLFYILSTGFRVIEFVVVSNIDLPHEEVTFGNQLHLWKCPTPDEDLCSNINSRLYDGWLELESVDAEQIRHSLAMIEVRRLIIYCGSKIQP
jgi:hypothetical protein